VNIHALTIVQHVIWLGYIVLGGGFVLHITDSLKARLAKEHAAPCLARAQSDAI
jgi:hypothetical protein